MKKTTLKPVIKNGKRVKKFNSKSYYFVLKTHNNMVCDKKIVVDDKKKKKKTTWIFLLCNIIIVGALLVYQFGFGETKPIGELFKESPYYRFLWLSLGAMIVYYLCEATCYSMLLKKVTGKYQFGIGLKTAIVGKYWDSLTPFGSGGQFAQVAYINSKGYKGNTSTSVVVGKYVFFEFAFVALGIIVLCLPCSLFEYGVVVKWLAFAGVMINLILTTFITLVSTNRKVCAVLVVGGLKLLHKMKIVKNYNKALFNSLRFIHNYQMSIKEFAKKPLLVLGEVLINALGLIAMAMVSYLIYLAFNYAPGVPVEHGLIQILTMTMLCQYATTFIPIPGGSGAAEVSFAAMFGKLFDNGAIFWALLFWRLFTYYLFILVGFFYTVLAPACRKRKNKKWRIITNKILKEYKTKEMKFGFKTNVDNRILKDSLITFCFLFSSILVELITFNRLGLGGTPDYILFDVVFWVGISLFFAVFPTVVKIIGFSIILFIQFLISGVNTSYFYVNGNLFDLETTFQAKNGIHVATPDVFDIKMIIVLAVTFVLTLTAFILLAKLIKVDKNTPKSKTNVLMLTCIMIFSMVFSTAGNNLVYNNLKIQKYNFNVWNGINLDNAITQEDISDTAETLASEKKLYDNLYNKLSSLKKFGTFGFYVKNFKNILNQSESEVSDDEIIQKTIDYINRGKMATIKTGVSQGNNVITVLLETGSWWGIDPYLTPNLYALSHDSTTATIESDTMRYVADNTVKLENYYSRNSTNVSEQHMLVGSFPMSNKPYYKLYSEQAENMKFDFSFANMLKGETEDIITSYFHPSTVNMYSREYTMKSFGFDNVSFIEDMEAFNSFAPYKFYNFVLDSAFFETQMDKVIPSTTQRFYSHISTITTHGSYLNKDENHAERIKPYTVELLANYDKVMAYYKEAMPKLHFPAQDGSDFFTEFVNYKSAYMDLDKAIGELFEALKTKGLLENTTVCLFADHYCYYNDLALQIYGYEHGDIAHPELYHIPAFIFDTKLANSLTNNHSDNTKLYDYSFSTPASLLPTMFDILNISYNSSYYLGVSLWDDDNTHNAQISSLSGVFNMDFFSYDIFEIENPEDYTDMDYLGRRYQFFCDVLYQYAKINYLDNMYTYNENIFKA